MAFVDGAEHASRGPIDPSRRFDETFEDARVEKRDAMRRRFLERLYCLGEAGSRMPWRYFHRRS